MRSGQYQWKLRVTWYRLFRGKIWKLKTKIRYGTDQGSEFQATVLKGKRRDKIIIVKYLF